MSRKPAESARDASPTDRAPHRGLTTLAAMTPLLVCLVSGVALLAASGGLENVQELVSLGGPLAYGAVVAAAAAVALVGLLARLSPAARVPGVLAAVFASLPWILGVAAWRLGTARVLDTLSYVDPSMHVALMAAGFSEMMISKLIGNLLGAAVLGGSGLALAIAALAPRAERRRAGIVVGVLAALPALAIALHALRLFDALALPLVVATLVALLSAACAGAGAANDAPHARAAALCAASSALSFSSVACAAMALPTLVERELLHGMGAMAPLGRIAAVRASALDTEHAARVAWALIGAALVVPAALNLWAARRARPDAAAWIGAVMLVVWIPVPLGLDAYAVEAWRRDAQLGCARPWDAMPEFRAQAFTADSHEGEVDLLVGPGVIRDRLGGRTPSADLDETGAQLAARIRALLASPAPAPEGEEQTPEWLEDEDGPGEPIGRFFGGSATPALSVAIHRDLPSARARTLIGALERARIDSFLLVGAPPGQWPREMPAHLCFLRDGPSYLIILLPDAYVDADEADLSVGELIEGGIRLLRPDGERVTLSARTPFGGDERWRRQIAYVRFDGDLSALMEGAVAAREARYELMIGTHASPPHGAWPAPAIDAAPTEPLGPLTRETILETVRAHTTQTRLCYERALRRDPSASGRVVVMIMIANSGQVSAAPIQESTLGDTEAETCLSREIETWAFPAHSGDAVGVSMPFVFSPAD